eukprot:1899934-Amphidinium_carterae.1
MLSQSASNALSKLLQKVASSEGRENGNGRAVRNILDRVVGGNREGEFQRTIPAQSACCSPQGDGQAPDGGPFAVCPSEAEVEG